MGARRELRTIDKAIQGLKSDDPDVVDQAWECLIYKFRRAAVPRLSKLLESDSAVFRDRAAWALGRIGDQRAVEPLVKAIEHRRSAGYNGTMVWVLYDLDIAHYLPRLIRVALSADDFEVRDKVRILLEEQIWNATPAEVDEIAQLVREAE
jgi:HEAT repeat protein